MKRLVLAMLLAALPFAAIAQTEQQGLVDRSTLALQDLLGNINGQDPGALLKKARAAMICPRIFRAGFFFGGEGGDCVLVARAGSGSWSAPAFYTMGSGSFGLQIGIQDAEVLMMILTEKGLSAVMDDQFKVGGDASIAVAVLGAGVQGATTAALDADIVAYSHARGLFGGITLTGSLMATRTSWNKAYYGRDLAARQIVVEMAVNNAGADPLRAALTKFGNP
jgi:lipid-binding SYLF domain-containing protein